MDSSFTLCTLLVSVLLVLESGQISEAREINEGLKWNSMDNAVVVHDKHAMDEERDDQRVLELEKHVHVHDHDHPSSNHIVDLMEPSLKVFFTVNDLKIGNKIPIYFPSKDPSKSPPLLSREESDSIPFSSSRIDYLLDFFSLSKDSPQAKAMETTLGHCEADPIIGETKFCATSLESLLDSTRGIFGLDAKFKVLVTTHLTEFTTPLQNYTVLEEPKVNLAPKIVGCHTMPYPYAVYYCHCQENDNQLFEVSLGGDGGERVKAVGLCHMDTSHWDPDHISFLVLGTKPGESPVCHFFPADNLVWVPAISA